MLVPERLPDSKALKGFNPGYFLKQLSLLNPAKRFSSNKISLRNGLWIFLNVLKILGEDTIKIVVRSSSLYISIVYISGATCPWLWRQCCLQTGWCPRDWGCRTPPSCSSRCLTLPWQPRKYLIIRGRKYIWNELHSF